MSLASVNSLARRLQRLQDQAARQQLANALIEFKCYWGNEDIGEREPGVTYIVTDWSNGGQLEREDQDQAD